MSATKKKRDKKYRPKAVNLDAVQWAIAGSSLQPEPVVQKIMGISLAAFDKLRQGIAKRHEWNVLAQSIAMSAVLADMQIGSNLTPQIAAGQVAIEEVAIRMAEKGTSTCYAHELEAIKEALAMYQIQCRLCTQAEFDRAIQRVKNLILSGTEQLGSKRIGVRIKETFDRIPA